MRRTMLRRRWSMRASRTATTAYAASADGSTFGTATTIAAAAASRNAAPPGPANATGDGSRGLSTSLDATQFGSPAAGLDATRWSRSSHVRSRRSQYGWPRRPQHDARRTTATTRTGESERPPASHRFHGGKGSAGRSTLFPTVGPPCYFQAAKSECLPAAPASWSNHGLQIVGTSSAHQ